MSEQFEVGEGATLVVSGMAPDGAVEDARFEVTDADGRRWAARVMSLTAIEALMASHRETGQNLTGSYLAARDILILATPTVESLIEVLTSHLQTGALQHWLSPQVFSLPEDVGQS